MTMLDLSEHVIAVAKENELAVTNLQLQKVMYFAIKEYLSTNGKNKFINDLYNEPFETWQYGPVVPEIYFRFNIFGSTPIRIDGKRNGMYKEFDESIVQLLNKNVFDLVEQSHKQSFWIENQKQKSEKAEYTLDDIARN